MVMWELRYRSPRTIDDVTIETYTESEEEAKALADRYLQTLTSPSIRFVRLRQLVVASSADHSEMASWKGKTIAKPTVDEDGEPVRKPSNAGARVVA